MGREGVGGGIGGYQEGGGGDEWDVPPHGVVSKLGSTLTWGLAGCPFHWRGRVNFFFTTTHDGDVGAVMGSFLMELFDSLLTVFFECL